MRCESNFNACVFLSCSHCGFLPDVECVNLRNPANGMVTTTGNDFGSRARYRCHSGYLLVGDQARVCEANGRWSGQEPECRCTYVNYLINVHSFITLTNQTTPKNVLFFYFENMKHNTDSW